MGCLVCVLRVFVWVLVEICMVIVVGYVACKIISSQWGLCSGDVIMLA